MVIGQNAKTDDIEINVCKTKHLTNTRSSSADDALKLLSSAYPEPGAGAGFHRYR